MCIQTKNTLVRLIICHFFLGLAYAGEPLESEIEQLRAIGAVTGSAVGYSAAPGAFFKLSKIFMQKGKEDDFLKLTSDENPILRAMGLLCLAQDKELVNTLKEHLSDQGIIHYFPRGCIGSTITVGNFARKLLRDPSHLDHWGSDLSLISEDELIGLDIEILAKDSTTALHDESRKALSNAFMKQKTSLTLSELRRYVPNLETYQIIKAIGRLGISPKNARLLITSAKTKNLDAESRLAAVSALTRGKSERLLNLIERERAHLNSIEGGNWGDRLFETFQNRILHEKLMKPIHAERMRRGMEGIKDKIIRAFSNSHPLAFTDFKDGFSIRIVLDHDDGRKAVKGWLINMSQKIEKCSQPWNTYADTPYALRFMIELWKEDGDFNRIFTEAERLELETNIQNAIKNSLQD